MNTAAQAAATRPVSTTRRISPSAWGSIRTLAHRDLRDALRSRWFLLYTIAFAALGLGLSYASAASAGGAGLAGFGRTAAGLINLVLLVVPLMALTAGAGTIASDRERGMLSYMLAQPIGRIEFLLGKFVGIGAALIASIVLGLGLCAVVLALGGLRTDPASIAWLAGVSCLLAAAMLSVGLLISAMARRASVAVGTAVFVWLALVFVTDLGIMAGAIALRLRIETLFGLSLTNPLQVFKMWSLHAVDAGLDVLGPAGLYAAEEFAGRLDALFAAYLVAWTIVPLTVAGAVMVRRSPL